MSESEDKIRFEQKSLIFAKIFQNNFRVTDIRNVDQLYGGRKTGAQEKGWSKIDGNQDSMRTNCEFAIQKNCESESCRKIAKRKRSEVESILCEANSLRFAIFRNRANSHCEFWALVNPGFRHLWSKESLQYYDFPSTKFQSWGRCHEPETQERPDKLFYHFFLWSCNLLIVSVLSQEDKLLVRFIIARKSLKKSKKKHHYGLFLHFFNPKRENLPSASHY